MSSTISPLVSVVMITYNHEQFIAEAIQGVLMQKCTFEVELIIADDNSPDNTHLIIEERIAGNQTFIPIKYFRRNSNLGMMPNLVSAINAGTGKYIAMCEGDDYWTDENKLQKQVDFLEKHPTFVFSTHRYKVFNSFDNSFAETIQPIVFRPYNTELKGVIVDKQAFHNAWLTQPLTCVIRKKELGEVIQKSNLFKYFRDYHFFYLLLNYGKGLCMDFVGGVYRVHSGGVYTSMNDVQKYKTASLIYQELYNYSKDKRFFTTYWNSILILSKNKQAVTYLIKPFFISLSLKEKAQVLHALIQSLAGFIKRKVISKKAVS